MSKSKNGSPNSAGPLDSATARELLSLLEEMARREERARQSEYGWYDEDGVRQGGLIAFRSLTRPACLVLPPPEARLLTVGYLPTPRRLRFRRRRKGGQYAVQC